MNLAAAWKLPFCFFIENNLYAVSTRVDEITADPRLSVRGQGFGIPGWRVDGMDPLAVYLATEAATERMRSGEGPAVIEVEVYRFFHQNGSYPGSAFGYRDKDEEALWRARDPLDRVAREMVALGLIDEAGVASVRAQAQEAMSAAVAELVEADPDKAGKRRIRPQLWPDPGFVNVGVRGDGAELASLTVLEPTEHEGPWRPVKFVEAVAGVMDRRMSRDERIVVFGEDVHRLDGGTNGATKGLAKYGENRLVGTPISENAFTGIGGGLALDGRFRPVVEFMYPDFMWVAADQVFNQIGKARHMFGGDNPVPFVLRTKVAMGTGYGSQHLMDPAGIFATSPGLADRRALDRRRLRRSDECRSGAAGSGAGHRARRPVRHGRQDPRRGSRLRDPARPRRDPAGRLRGHRHQLSVDGGPQPRGDRADRTSTPS